MYPIEEDSEVISYTSFYDIPDELVLKEDLTLVDDMTTYIVNDYMEILVKSRSKDQKLSAIGSLYEWINYSLHLGQIFVLNRLAINEQDLDIKKSILALLKFLKNNKV